MSLPATSAPPTSTTRGGGAVNECGNCNARETWLLHTVRLRGIYRRLCTSCVLILHPASFCPTCFTFYDSAPPHPTKRIACGSCSSFSHSHCVTSPPTGNYLCPPCKSPPFSFFDIKRNPDGARPVNSKLANALQCAGQIAVASMGKAVLVSRAEAERKVREAALARKRAREALEHSMAVGKEKEVVRHRTRNDDTTDDQNGNGNGVSHD